MMIYLLQIVATQGSVSIWGVPLFFKVDEQKFSRTLYNRVKKVPLPDFEIVSRKWAQPDSLGFPTQFHR